MAYSNIIMNFKGILDTCSEFFHKQERLAIASLSCCGSIYSEAAILVYRIR